MASKYISLDLIILKNVNKLKIEFMVAMARQYISCADEEVQIKQAAFFDKGAQRELCHNKGHSSFKSGYQLYFFITGSFMFKLPGMFNIALNSVHKRRT